MPRRTTIVFEQSFDESSGIQLIIIRHSAAASTGLGDWRCASDCAPSSTSSPAAQVVSYIAGRVFPLIPENAPR
jgi:hypothetical protein